MMSHCESCEAELEVADRFCPACGTPNSGGRLHPRFGPALRELPSIVEVGGDGKGCPRCDAPVAGHDPYCRYCGMSLEEYHRIAARPAHLGVWTTPGPIGVAHYRALGPLSSSLRVLLAIDAVIALTITVVAASSLANYGDAFSSVQADGNGPTPWTWWLQVAMAAAIGLTVPVFLTWFARAHRNLGVLAVGGLRRSARLAVACWFIPFVNLVLPKEMVDDLWRASDPSTPVFSARWRMRTVPFRAHMWWVSSLIAAVTLVATQWVLPAPGELEASAGRLGTALVLFAHPALACSAVLMALLVRDVAERQARRVEVLGPPSVLRQRAEEPPVEEPAPMGPVLVHSSAFGVSGRY